MSGTLHSMVKRVSAAHRRRARARCWAGAWAPLCAITLGAALLDAVWPVSPWARLALGALIVLAAGRAALATLRGRADRKADDAWGGEALERASGAPAGSIVGALELAGRDHADPLGGALSARALERAAGTVSEADVRRVIATQRSAPAWGALGAAALALVGALALTPNLAAREWARFSDPFGEHPAWTRLRFETAIEPAAPLVGDDVRVIARIDPAAKGARASVALADGARVAMVEGVEGALVATLRRVREPVRAWIEAEGGRGEVFEIVPEARPRLLGASARVVSPDGAERITSLDEAGLTGELTAQVGSAIELTAVSTMALRDGDGAEARGRSATRRVTADREGVMELALRPAALESGLSSVNEARLRVVVVGNAAGAAAEGGPGAGVEGAGALERAASAEGEGEDEEGAAGGVDVARGEISLPAGGAREGEGGGDGEPGEAQERLGGEVVFVEPERAAEVRGVRREAGEAATAGVGGGGAEALDSVPPAYRALARRYLEEIARLKEGGR